MNLGVTEEPRGSGGKLGSPTHDGQQVVPIICPFPSPFLQVDPKALLQPSEEHRPPALRDSTGQ